MKSFELSVLYFFNNFENFFDIVEHKKGPDRKIKLFHIGNDGFFWLYPPNVKNESEFYY